MKKKTKMRSKQKARKTKRIRGGGKQPTASARQNTNGSAAPRKEHNIQSRRIEPIGPSFGHSKREKAFKTAFETQNWKAYANENKAKLRTNGREDNKPLKVENFEGKEKVELRKQFTLYTNLGRKHPADSELSE